MATQNKTRPTGAAVSDYIAEIEDDSRRKDCETLTAVMSRLSDEEATMWGPSIVGFGEYHYKYDSGREGDALRVGFSSRARNISIYIMPGYQDFDDELSRLGKHSRGKSCLYIKRLSDVDMDVLEEIIAKGLSIMDERYPR